MNVSLVSITKPLIQANLHEMTAEDLIVYCARVSNPGNQTNFETSEKLIQYLIKNKHHSPFEMVDITFEIITSRAIAAQILRHKSASFQEFSQRFAKIQELEPLEWRMQGKTNRQVSEEEVSLPDNLQEKVCKLQKDSLELYNELIDIGVGKECARFILPLNTRTRLYAKNNVRNWLAYLNVRLEKNTQKEHRDIAFAIRDIFIREFPTISKALNNLQEGGFM